MSPAGYLDLVVGNADGELNYYKNTGTAFVLMEGDDNPFDDIDVGDKSAPALGDFNNDGTLRQRPSINKPRQHVSRRLPGPRSGQ